MNNKLEPTNAFMLKSNNKEYYKKVLFFSHFLKDYSQINNYNKKIHIYTLHYGTYKRLHAKKQKNNIKIIMAEVKLLVKNISL